MTLYDEIHRPIHRQLVHREERHDILAVPAHLLRCALGNLLVRRERIHRVPGIVRNGRRIVAVTDKQIVCAHRLRENRRRALAAKMPITLRVVRHHEDHGEIEPHPNDGSRPQYARVVREQTRRENRRRQERGEAVCRVLGRHALKKERHNNRPEK